MLRFLADEDFDHRILRGLEIQEPSLDIIAIQDVDRRGEGDPANLQYAAKGGRILLTHDKRLIRSVLDQIEAGKPMPGIFVVHREASIRKVIDDILDLARYSLEGEGEGQVLFLPLR